MLSEIIWTEKDKYCMILFIHGIVKKEKSQTHGSRKQNGGYQGLGVDGGKMGDICQKVETFSYKMNKFWRHNVQHGYCDG